MRFLIFSSPFPQEHGHEHQWMAFVDADEFLVIRDGTPDLPALLRDYTDSAALGVFWVVFGSSGHLTAPEHGALGSYYRCAALCPDPCALSPVPYAMCHKPCANCQCAALV